MATHAGTIAPGLSSPTVTRRRSVKANAGTSPIDSGTQMSQRFESRKERAEFVVDSSKCIKRSRTLVKTEALIELKTSRITSKLSERSIEFADLITERGKILNPEYNICRDQPTSRASPLRINDLLSTVVYFGDASEQCF